MKKRFNSILFYTLLFLVVAVIVFSAFLLQEKSLLLKMDAFNQHFIIFKNYHEIIRNGFSLFSWNISLGEGLIGQYAYYIIGDPFFYLSLPFESNVLQYVYSFLIFLRIYCIGLSFLFFCKYKKEDNVKSILGALVYAFSSYALLNSLMHPFFANAAILFPLLLIAVEKFLKENNWKWVIILFFISIVSNFYFCYVLIFLSFIYAIVYYWLEIGDKNIKDFFIKLLKAACCLIISVLLSCFILLPILYAFLNSGRVISNLSIVYDWTYFKSLIGSVLAIKEVDYSTTIGVSSLLLLAFPFVISNFKKNKSLIIYFLILTIGLLCPFFGSLLNGLSYTSNRWTFAYCFILSYFVVRGIKLDLDYSLKDFRIIIFLLSGYLGFVYVFNNSSLLLTLKSISLVVILLLLIALYKKFNLKRIVYFFMLGIFVLNIGYMGRVGLGYWISKCILYDEFNNTYNSLNGDFDNFDKAIEKIKEDKDFYRIGRYPRWLQNSAQYFDYMSSSSYLSISNKYLKQLSDDLGNFDVEVSKPLLEFDNRTRITSLFGVKYFVTEKNNNAKVPYEYYKSFDLGDLEVYSNKFYSLPVLFYDEIYLYEDWLKANVLDREYLLTKAAVLEEDIFKRFEKSDFEYESVVEEIDFDVKNYDLKDNAIVVKNSGDSISFDFESKDDSELYLHIKNLEFIPENSDFSYQLKFKINGVTNVRTVFDKETSPYYYPMKDIYLNLGSVEGKNELEWIFNRAGTYSFDDISILSVDMTSYPLDMYDLSENVWLNSYDDDSIIVNVNNSKDGVLQLSSGFSKGWTAYVDGEKVDTFLVNRGFVGIYLSSGNHQVTFVYETPYLAFGSLISSITIVGICLFSFKKRSVL